MVKANYFTKILGEKSAPLLWKLLIMADLGEKELLRRL
jgi:hypothetical protein